MGCLPMQNEARIPKKSVSRHEKYSKRLQWLFFWIFFDRLNQPLLKLFEKWLLSVIYSACSESGTISTLSADENYDVRTHAREHVQAFQWRHSVGKAHVGPWKGGARSIFWRWGRGHFFSICEVTKNCPKSARSILLRGRGHSVIICEATHVTLLN